jgi:hypothetical protein
MNAIKPDPAIAPIKIAHGPKYTIATLTDSSGTLRNVTVNPRILRNAGAAQAVHVALDERERIARAELDRVRAIRDVLPSRLSEITP